jgi:hypothetical protein
MISLKSAITVGLVIAAPPNADLSLAPWFSSLRVPGADLALCPVGWSATAATSYTYN